MADPPSQHLRALDRAYKHFHEHSKKLQVLTKLYGEADMVNPALQQYKDAVEDVIACGRQLEQNSEYQSLAPQDMQSQLQLLQKQILTKLQVILSEVAATVSETGQKDFGKFQQVHFTLNQDLLQLLKLCSQLQGHQLSYQGASPVQDHASQVLPRRASENTAQKMMLQSTPPSKQLPQISNLMAKQVVGLSLSGSNSSLYAVSELVNPEEMSTRSNTMPLKKREQSSSWPRQAISPYNSSRVPIVPTMLPLPEEEDADRKLATTQKQLVELADSLGKSSDIALQAHQEAVMLKSRKLQNIVEQLDFLVQVCLYDQQICYGVLDEFIAVQSKLKNTQQQHSEEMLRHKTFVRELEDRCRVAEQNNAFAQQSLNDMIRENAHLKQTQVKTALIPDAEVEDIVRPSTTIVASQQASPNTPYSNEQDLSRSKSLPTSPLQQETATQEAKSSINELTFASAGEIDYSQAIFGNKSGYTLVAVDIVGATDSDVIKAEEVIESIEKLLEAPSKIHRLVDPIAIAPVQFKRPPLAVIRDPEKQKGIAAIIIQKQVRGYLQRRKYRKVLVRQMIAKEILETEINYVRGLASVMKYYVSPLRARASNNLVIIPHDKINVMFFHVKEILICNTMLLKKLGKRIINWNDFRQIGEIFCEFSRQFSLYSLFVSNYNRSMDVYRQYEHSPPFAQFQVELKMKQGKRALNLADLLITPIQRIPRYVLLLKELIKNTEPRHADYSQLLDAIDRLQQMASFINERKRDSERMGEVGKVQAKITHLPFTLVNSNRRFVLEGELGEMSEAGKLKQRHIILLNDLVICTQPQKGRFKYSATTYEYRWSAPIQELQVGPIERVHERRYTERSDKTSLKLAIGLLGDERKILIASSIENMEKWLQAFADAKFQSDQLLLNNSTVHKNSSNGKKSPIGLTTDTLATVTFIRQSIQDVYMSDFASPDTIQNLLSDTLDKTKAEIKVENNILSGLQRLDNVYGSSTSVYSNDSLDQLQAGSSNSLKSKAQVFNHKQQSIQTINVLERKLTRVSEMQSQLKALISSKPHIGLSVSQKDVIDAINATDDSVLTISYIEQSVAQRPTNNRMI